MHAYQHTTMQAMGRDATLLLAPDNCVIAKFTGKGHERTAEEIAAWLDEIDAKAAAREHAEMLVEHGEAGA